MSFSGFEFLGKHSFRDMGFTLETRTIGQPSKLKPKYKPPYSNHEVDFSMIYGSQVYNNRQISYRFNIGDIRTYTKAEMNVMRTKLINWLMNSNGKQKLYDDHFPGYYFLAEVEEEPVFNEQWNYGTIDVTFEAYPFMISVLPEGHDIWDELNFELDVAQEMSYSLDGEYSFKKLAIGSTATIGAWATTYASGGGRIPVRNIGVSGTITGMENVTSSRSKRAYTVTGIDGLVVEQDIIQAHIKPLEIELINPGTASVTPEVNLNYKATIVKGGRSYNFLEGGNFKNDVFHLDSGVNKLTIYSLHENQIEFNFHKELI